MRNKLEDMYMVRKLNYVNSLSEVNKVDKSTILREIVQELKGQLLKAYDEACNTLTKVERMLESFNQEGVEEFNPCEESVEDHQEERHTKWAPLC